MSYTNTQAQLLKVGDIIFYKEKKEIVSKITKGDFPRSLYIYFESKRWAYVMESTIIERQQIVASLS